MFILTLKKKHHSPKQLLPVTWIIFNKYFFVSNDIFIYYWTFFVKHIIFFVPFSKEKNIIKIIILFIYKVYYTIIFIFQMFMYSMFNVYTTCFTMHSTINQMSNPMDFNVLHQIWSIGLLLDASHWQLTK